MRLTRRSPAAKLTVAAGFGVLAWGSWLGQSPTWPPRPVWAWLAAVTAAAVIISVAVPTVDTVAFAAALLLIAAMSRAVGYAADAHAPTGLRLTGLGVWAVVVALAFQVRAAERHR